MKAATINITVWIALTLAVALFGSLAAWHTSSITRHTAQAQGSVSGLLPDNHLSFEYVYAVAGVTHSGSATAGEANRDFKSLKIGDSVPVFYDTQNPSISTVGPPDMPAVHAIGSLIAACAAIPFILMLLMHRLEVLPRWAFFQAARPPESAKNS
jgi:hypothetical protein